MYLRNRAQHTGQYLIGSRVHCSHSLCSLRALPIFQDKIRIVVHKRFDQWVLFCPGRAEDWQRRQGWIGIGPLRRGEPTGRLYDWLHFTEHARVQSPRTGLGTLLDNPDSRKRVLVRGRNIHLPVGYRKRPASFVCRMMQGRLIHSFSSFCSL